MNARAVPRSVLCNHSPPRGDRHNGTSNNPAFSTCAREKTRSDVPGCSKDGEVILPAVGQIKAGNKRRAFARLCRRPMKKAWSFDKDAM
jgi:hypothetical protein